MRRLAVLIPLALAGCPPPSHYLITDVTTPRGPLPDAVVAADCTRGDRPVGGSLRTDAEGRARLRIYPQVDASSCSVTVAKPGYVTVEIGGVNLCTTSACPPSSVELREAGAPLSRPDELAPPRSYVPQARTYVPEPPRTYAPPPLGLGTVGHSRGAEVAR